MKPISGVRYSLYSQNEINSTNILIQYIKNEGDYGTTKDNRLGAMDGYICKTCNSTELECFGHWGKVRIYDNVIIKPEYINEVVRLLKYICLRCGFLRSRDPYSLDNLEGLPGYKIQELSNKILSKKKSCWNTQCMQPYLKVMFSKKKVCLVVKQEELAIPNICVYQKLTSIHKRFWPLLGLHQNPANLFYKEYFPVPPLIIRPAISFWVDSIPKETNEITYMLNTIVKYCIQNAEEYTIQKAVIEYDNNKILVTNTSNINLSYITSGKNNMIRSYIVARRKDQTARSVLGPDSSLSVAEVGIPDYVRQTLTEKIFVNAFTIDRVRELFKSNKIKFYFNKSLRQLTSLKKNKFIKNKIHLLPGDWVEIDLQEFSNIIFGRQPSLHRYNVISSSIRATAENTIKISPGIANSQNADFDGDEEWMIVEQNPKSVIEQSVLMFPTTLLKHDVSGLPVYGSIQDEILAAYILFQMKDVTAAAVLNLLGRYGNEFPADKALYSGREIFRFLIGYDITYPGILDRGSISTENIDSNFIVAMKHLSLSGLVSDYASNLEGVRFIDKMSYVLKRFLTIYGFSVTFRNLCADLDFVDELYRANVSKLNAIKRAYAEYLDDVAAGTVIPLSEFAEAEALDGMLVNLTNHNVKAIDDYMKRVLRSDPDNNLLRMSCVGYKMNPTELMYILGTYGQQKVDGKHIETRVLGRVLPYYLPDSRDPEGLGYILNSLIKGLTGPQYYFTMLIARSQSIDIVCETSRTGTLARKIIKKLEDVMVDGYGQIVYYDYLVKYAANYTKTAGSVCKPVELLVPSESMTWYLEILDLWNKLKHGFIYNQGQKLARYLIFPFNFKVFVKPAAEKDAPLPGDKLYGMIEEFVEDVRLNDFFLLTDVDYIKYAMLTHLNPSRIQITQETFDLVISRFREKLRYSLGGGFPIGIIYAQVLSEKFTQQALSSFHTTEKSGGIKKKLGFNEFNNLTSLSKNRTEIITLISEDYRKLEAVKINFEFVCLGDLFPDISIRYDRDDDLYRVSIVVNRLYVKRESLTVPVVESLVERFVSFSVLVKEWSMDTRVLDQYRIDIELALRFTQPSDFNRNKFMMMLPGAANKGKISKYKIPIYEYSCLEDHNVSRTKYRLTVELANLKELGIFDLLDVNVIPGTWNTYEIFGIEAVKSYLCESLLNTYGEGLDYLYPCCDLLSSIMCVNYEPESINKFKFGNISTLKKATFGDNKAFINSALQNRTERIQDNSSCHFFSKVPRIGTGYFTYYFNLDKLVRFRKAVEKQLEEEQEVKLQSLARREF
ncbi:ORF128 [Saltwater crocodilepox virus]|nr:RNA polymerase subunit RPO147 [Saltwater crocodilepox virus]AVD69463.1 RNA polymerase subunit RPO147 [Saltwater crocodilepox virus]QGT46566.1 ORF128 [Saltwater crocodilepox virus]QGT46782.1 ORF128 [Saltwater crocodilepox virus]QGT46998.1 ORF128 [Saltwater crocodilepox virus]